MAPREQSQYGQCPQHGQVKATRQMPSLSFPFMLTAVRWFRARKQPYLCPQCGQPVQT